MRNKMSYLSINQEKSTQWITIKNPNPKEWSRIKDHLAKGRQVEAETEQT